MEKLIMDGLFLNVAIGFGLFIILMLIYKKGSKVTKIALMIFIGLITLGSIKLLCLKYFYDETIGVTQRTYYSGKPPRKTVAYYYKYNGKTYYSNNALNPRERKNFKGDGSKYKVRIVTFYPAWDIIDFSQPVESE